MEKTFIMIKPDGVKRQLIGEVIKRFENKGFTLKASKFLHIDETLAKKHYEEHIDKDFFKDLVDFITSGPVLAMVWEGEDVIKLSRLMMGKTNPLEASPGTIRGDFATHMRANVVHGSDSPESADKEINLYFDENDIIA